MTNTISNIIPNTLQNPTYPQLRALRPALLALHRTLLDAERIGYEQIHGWVASGELLQLVIHHPHFAWLHPLSELIVQLDEVLRSDEPVPPDAVQTLLEQARSLLTPCETGNAFEQRYYNALQRDPAAVLTHAEVSRLLAQD